MVALAAGRFMAGMPEGRRARRPSNTSRSGGPHRHTHSTVRVPVSRCPGVPLFQCVPDPLVLRPQHPDRDPAEPTLARERQAELEAAGVLDEEPLEGPAVL